MIAFDFKNSCATGVKPLYRDKSMELCTDCFGYIHANLDLTDTGLFKAAFSSFSLGKQILAVLLGTTVRGINWCTEGVRSSMTLHSSKLQAHAGVTAYRDVLLTTHDQGKNVGVCLAITEESQVIEVEKKALEDRRVFEEALKRKLDSYYVISMYSRDSNLRFLSEDKKSYIIRRDYRCNVVIAPSSLGILLGRVSDLKSISSSFHTRRTAELKKTWDVRNALWDGNISSEEALSLTMDLCSDSVCPYALAMHLLV